MIKNNRFFPNIYDYLEVINKRKKISIVKKQRGKIINNIISEIDVSKLQAEIIIELFFTTIKSRVIKDDIITLSSFGKIYISSPKKYKHKNKKKIMLHYTPSKKIIKIINND